MGLIVSIEPPPRITLPSWSGEFNQMVALFPPYSGRAGNSG
jgi:hypothetical protein